MAIEDYLTIRPAGFGLLDRITSRIDDTVMIVPRHSGLGAGSLSFLGEAGDHPAIRDVYVAVRDVERLKRVMGPLESQLHQLDIAVTPVEIDSTISRTIGSLAGGINVISYVSIMASSRRHTAI